MPFGDSSRGSTTGISRQPRRRVRSRQRPSPRRWNARATRAQPARRSATRLSLVSPSLYRSSHSRVLRSCRTGWSTPFERESLRRPACGSASFASRGSDRRSFPRCASAPGNRCTLGAMDRRGVRSMRSPVRNGCALLPNVLEISKSGALQYCLSTSVATAAETTSVIGPCGCSRARRCVLRRCSCPPVPRRFRTMTNSCRICDPHSHRRLD